MATKTLLVGLGGTGCEIVSRVKKMIIKPDPNVQFVGFDTDIAWDGADKSILINTSRDMPVRDYLSGIDNWREWFPDDPQILRRKMTSGAGQMRILSRLAFAETVKSGRLGILDRAIRELQVARGDTTPGDFRVMIVSSFAGGTGSGMFIQTALFLREYLKDKYGLEDIIIRGLFAMPDLYVSTNPSRVQQESMYANAYAALKELNAINNVCLSDDQSAYETNMQIDNLFDSKNAREHGDKRPFDFIFFVDNLNTRKEVLPTIEDYKQLIATATYMQVYSPMTKIGLSREDNNILSWIKGKGKNIYGSVGAARIVYPYEDLVKYCGKRATIESIDKSWTYFDREYKKAKAYNKKQMQLDPTVSELNRQENYIDNVNSVLNDGNLTFNFITNDIFDVNSNGVKNDRAKNYVKTVEEYVVNKIKNDAQIKSTSNDATPSDDNLNENKVKEVSVSVNGYESNLREYYTLINDKVKQYRGILSQSIIPDDLKSEVVMDGEWNIIKFVTKNNHFVHPLSIRMLLYKLRALISKKYSEAYADASDKTDIDWYFGTAKDNPFDKESTKEVETLDDIMSRLNIFNKASFIKDYLEKSKAQKERLDDYLENKIVSEVFSEVLKRIDAIIEQYEKLFDNLEDINNELKNEVKIFEEVTYTNTAESTVYLCCTPEEKRDLYESLSFSCSDSNDNGVYDFIFYSLYDAAFKALEEKEKRAKGIFEDSTKSMSEIFRESVVKRNIEDVKVKCKDILDIDVYKALTKATGGDPDRIDEYVQTALSKAQPYLTYETKRKIETLGSSDGVDSAYTLTFWGVNPDVAKEIKGNTGNPVTILLSQGDSGANHEVVEDEEYSKYEISCYQALYCVALNEIPKFLDTDDAIGLFYRSYSKKVSEMVKHGDTALTPHLDIRWHRRDFLPMISGKKNAEDDERTARAIWLALIYGGLQEKTVAGKKVLFASFARTRGVETDSSRDILYEGKNIQISNVYELYKALQVDETTVKRFIEVFEKSFDEDKKLGIGNFEFTGPRAKRFAKSLISEKDAKDRNALNVIARFVDNAKAKDDEKRLFVESLQTLIDEFCDGLPDRRKAELRALIFKASRFSKNKSTKAGFEDFIDFDDWSGAQN